MRHQVLISLVTLRLNECEMLYLNKRESLLKETLDPALVKIPRSHRGNGLSHGEAETPSEIQNSKRKKPKKETF